MTPEQKDICKRALDNFGKQSQIIKAMEECAELIQALAKSRTSDGDWLMSEVVEEMADVQIMIYQLSLLCGQEDFEHMLNYKISRLATRIRGRSE